MPQGEQKANNRSGDNPVWCPLYNWTTRLPCFPTPAGRAFFAALDSPFVRQKINILMVGWREGFFGVFWLRGVRTG
jgi:hypothetical protein